MSNRTNHCPACSAAQRNVKSRIAFEHTCGLDKEITIGRFYEDELHGFRAKAVSKTMAWMLIRNECHKKKLPVPTFDKIKEL